MATYTTSAGGIVINNNGEVALAQHDDNAWSFPKGHVEENEELQTTAKREIYEETGISDLVFLKELPSYQRPDAGNPDIIKTIHLFLFRTSQVNIKPTDGYTMNAKWFNKNEVAEALTYQKDKKFFNSVINEI